MFIRLATDDKYSYPGTPNGGLTIPGITPGPGGMPGIMGPGIPGIPVTGVVEMFGESV